MVEAASSAHGRVRIDSANFAEFAQQLHFAPTTTPKSIQFFPFCFLFRSTVYCSFSCIVFSLFFRIPRWSKFLQCTEKEERFRQVSRAAQIRRRSSSEMGWEAQFIIVFSAHLPLTALFDDFHHLIWYRFSQCTITSVRRKQRRKIFSPCTCITSSPPN